MTWVPGSPEPLDPLAVACSFCHAPAGQRCVGVALQEGGPVLGAPSGPHLARENDANNAAWAAHRAAHTRD